MSDQTEDHSQCPGCGGVEVKLGKALDDGHVCAACGLVHNGEGWESFETDLSIGIQQDDETESASWREEICIEDATDQHIVEMLSMVDSVSTKIGLSETERVRSAQLVLDAWRCGLVHGRTIDGAVAACAYLTCRESGSPRPAHVVAECCAIDVGELHNMRKVVYQDMDLEIDPPSPSAYLPYLTADLGVSEKCGENASELLSNSQLPSGNPVAIAAAGLYLISKDSHDPSTLREIGDAAGVTKETIWRHSTDLKEVRFEPHSRSPGGSND